MRQQLLAYAEYMVNQGGWPDELAEDFSEIIGCHHDDPEQALACVVLANSQTDDAGFLGFMACGNLEDVLRDPSPEMLDRIVTEARKSARFRWLLSHPYRVAIAPASWDAIENFRITGPHQEPSADTLPPRD